MSKALGLLSGGLDSSLAALALKRQGVEVTCVSFVTPFFGSAKAEKAADRLEIPLIVRDIGEIHLQMVKAPQFGYGKNMNPCIDCHAMMFRLAGQIMQEQGFDFLFSGEVLGQRPMSQNPRALRSVAEHSGFPDRILRPLSARLLPRTPMEEQGLVDRERLLDIQGRSRRRQDELAREWDMGPYPPSGGGCLLTEKGFSDRLRDLLQSDPAAGVREVQLLKTGRYFRLSPQARLFLGRNQEENQALEALARPTDRLLRAVDFNGPLGLLVGEPAAPELRDAAALIAVYGQGRAQATVEVRIWTGNTQDIVTVAPAERALKASIIG
ncbi:MAG: thiamine biosynthesis protein [Desulfuromonadales bacterium]